MPTIAFLKTRRGQAVATSIVLGAIVAVSSLWSASRAPTICLFQLLTTLPCPSCGMTRAFIALGHGHLRDAIAFNVASPFVYAAAWLGLTFAIVQAATNRPVLANVWNSTRVVVYPATLAIMASAWMVNLWGRFSH
jgi:hypothetical protein